MTIKVTDEKKFTAEELAELMTSVGWGEDATPDVFLRAMMNATHAISARADGKLVVLCGVWTTGVGVRTLIVLRCIRTMHTGA